MPIGIGSPGIAHLHAERVARGQPALLHRARGQAGEADHVAGGVDVPHLGAVRRSTAIRPRVSASSPACLEIRGRRSHPGGRPSRARRRAGDPLAAGEVGDRAAVVLLDGASPSRRTGTRRRCRAGGTAAPRRSARRRTRAARARCSTTVTLVPSAANIDAYSMPITPAPTTSSDDGMSVQVEDVVGVEDRPPVELDARSAARAGCRRRSRSCDAVSRRSSPSSPRHAERVRVDEAARRRRRRARGFGQAGSGPRRPRGSITCSIRQNRSCAVMSALTR